MKKNKPRASHAAAVKSDRPPAVGFTRRDATGHLDPAYAAGLRALEPPSDPHDPQNPDAFLRGMHSADPLAELLGEDFVRGANSAEDDAQDDAEVTEEIGGPFIVTTGKTEYAFEPDLSNPPHATREPFPTSSAGALRDLVDDETGDGEETSPGG